MSFETEGFFSPEIDRFREAVRSTIPGKPWFDYAHDLNALGLELLRSAFTERTERDKFTMHGIFARAHQSFQAAVLLIERGMIGDARTILRSGVEGAIAICALAADPSFVDQLIEAHHANQRKVARLLLETPRYLDSYSATEIAAVRAAIASVDVIEAATPGKKLKEIKWGLSRQHCPDLYQLLYRSLSSDGTHATLSSFDRYVVTDANMQITAFKAAPDGEGIVEALSAACLMFIWAADPFAAAVDRPDLTLRSKYSCNASAVCRAHFRERRQHGRWFHETPGGIRLRRNRFGIGLRRIRETGLHPGASGVGIAALHVGVDAESGVEQPPVIVERRREQTRDHRFRRARHGAWFLASRISASASHPACFAESSRIDFNFLRLAATYANRELSPLIARS